MLQAADFPSDFVRIIHEFGLAFNPAFLVVYGPLLVCKYRKWWEKKGYFGN